MKIDPALVVTALLAVDGARTSGTAPSLAALRSSIRSAASDDPMQAALVTVLGSSVLFYLAERGHNTKVVRLEDAFVYCTTFMSVGHADVLAQTPSGKAIAAMLTTFGPALAARIFDPTRRESDRERDEHAGSTREIVRTLEAILEQLRSTSASPRETVAR
jgi:hypothetical protein